MGSVKGFKQGCMFRLLLHSEAATVFQKFVPMLCYDENI